MLYSQFFVITFYEVASRLLGNTQQPSNVFIFYRWMHVVQSTVYCYRKLPVHTSARPSVTLVICGHISWEPQHRRYNPRRTTKIWVKPSGVAVFRKKTCNICERNEIGSKLLLMTNRKLHTYLRLVPKSTILDVLEGPI